MARKPRRQAFAVEKLHCQVGEFASWALPVAQIVHRTKIRVNNLTSGQTSRSNRSRINGSAAYCDSIVFRAT
jgi:hypothetical protein